MPYQIVDEYRTTAYTQRLAAKARQLGRLEVMCEQAATHQVETPVGEGKRERIGDYGAISGQEVRRHAIEVGYVESDSIV